MIADWFKPQWRCKVCGREVPLNSAYCKHCPLLLSILDRKLLEVPSEINLVRDRGLLTPATASRFPTAVFFQTERRQPG